MIVDSVKKAWEIADSIFPTDYAQDMQSSERAGYPIYRSTLAIDCTDNYQPFYCTIYDLNSCLEVTITFANWEQKITRINIEKPKMTMEQILNLAHTAALSQWAEEKDRMLRHPGKLAEACEREAWEKVEEIERLMKKEAQKNGKA